MVWGQMAAVHGVHPEAELMKYPSKPWHKAITGQGTSHRTRHKTDNKKALWGTVLFLSNAAVSCGQQVFCTATRNTGV
jgi:hypothetical protein